MASTSSPVPRRTSRRRRHELAENIPVNTQADKYDVGDRYFVTYDVGLVKTVAFNAIRGCTEVVHLSLAVGPPDLKCIEEGMRLRSEVHHDLITIVMYAFFGKYTTSNNQLNFANQFFVRDVQHLCDTLAYSAPTYLRDFQLFVVYSCDEVTVPDTLVFAPMSAPCTWSDNEEVCPIGTSLSQMQLCQTQILWSFRAYLERLVQKKERESHRNTVLIQKPKPKPNACCPCNSGLKYKKCCGRRLCGGNVVAEFIEK